MSAVLVLLPWLVVVLTVGALGWSMRRTPHRAQPGLAFGLWCLSAVCIATTAAANGWSGLDFIRFSRSWLSILGLIGFHIIYRLCSSADQRPKGIQAQSADALFAGLYALLVVAAMAPRWRKARSALTVVVVVDKSLSVDRVPSAPQTVATALQSLRKGMRKNDRLGVVVFGRDAATQDVPTKQASSSPGQEVRIDRGGSHIEAGIRQALAAAPSDTSVRLLLISDGAATRGDALQASRAAKAASVPIDALPLVAEVKPQLELQNLMAPNQARQGEAIDLRAVVVAPAPIRAELRWQLGEGKVHRSPIELQAGQQVILQTLRPKQAGLHALKVSVAPLSDGQGQAESASRLEHFIDVSGRAQALVIDGEGPAQTAFVCAAFEQTGFRCRGGASDLLETSVVELARYDLIVLSDTPARRLHPTTLENLRRYVVDLGGGLLLLGGPHSFGPGGFSKTAIEKVAPVHFDIKHKRRRNRLSQVIAIDTSGSMAAPVGQQTKLQLANEAAVRSASLLANTDALGVLHVDSGPTWSVPLQPLKQRAAIDRAIRGAGIGGGGIYVDVAQREAYARLRSEPKRLKHLLLFADGSDAEHLDAVARRRAQSAFREGITTSCVALGKGKDVRALKRLATAGGGRFYLVNDAKRLPSIFAQETFSATRAALHEEPFVPRVAGAHPITQGLDLSTAPPLGGYVITRAKRRAQLLLSGPDKDPIAATWSTGLGRCAAFASDFKGGWGKAWTNWPDASTFLGQLAQHTARRPLDPGVTLQATSSGGQIRATATVVDSSGRLFSFRPLHVTVLGPRGYRKQSELVAVAPGRYRGRVPATAPGNYVLSLSDSNSGTRLATAGVSLRRNEELRHRGSDLAHLRAIARESNGRIVATADDLFRQRKQLRRRPKPLARWLLTVGSLLLLLMVAMRRLPLLTLIEKAKAVLLGLGKPKQASNHDSPGNASKLLERRRARQQEAELNQAAAPIGPMRKQDHNPDPSQSSPAADLPVPKKPPTQTQPASREAKKSTAQLLVEKRRKRR